MIDKDVIKLLESYIRENKQGNYLDYYIPRCICCKNDALDSELPVIHKEGCIVANCENEVYSKKAFKQPLEKSRPRLKQIWSVEGLLDN